MTVSDHPDQHDGAEHAQGFAWAAPHDRVLRASRALFILSSALLALYVSSFAVIVFTCIRLAAFDDDGISRPARDLGPAGIALVVIAGYALVTALIAMVGRRGLPRRTRRHTGARPAEQCDAHHAQQTLESFALARGIAQPRLWVIDDPAPNSCTFGDARRGNVCLTTGALALPADELDALCAHQVTALTTRAYGYATAAVDLSSAAQWWTTALWATAGFVLVSTIIGVPPVAAAATVLGVVLLVTITKPLLALNDRVLPRLLDDVDALCDLETVRLTDEPTALAHLLLHLIEDRRNVHSARAVAHRWFERDGAARGLTTRAAFAVQLAGGGDAALRARLARDTSDAAED